MTPERAPVLLVLDDREGLVRAAPGVKALGDLCEVRVADRPLQDVPDGDLTDVRVLLAVRERTRLDAATLRRFPRLELVLQTGTHAYHVDAEEVAKRNIPVALGRRAQAVRAAVPELTLLLMLACMRRLGEASKALGRGEWPALVGRTLAGRRVGVLGLGRHGLRVAGLCRVLGMEVVSWDRAADQEGGAAPTGRLGPDGILLLPLREHPLRALPNVVLTPHVGWTTEEVLTEYAEIAAQQATDYLAGDLDPDDLLDREVLPGPDALGGLRNAVQS